MAGHLIKGRVVLVLPLVQVIIKGRVVLVLPATPLVFGIVVCTPIIIIALQATAAWGLSQQTETPKRYANIGPMRLRTSSTSASVSSPTSKELMIDKYIASCGITHNRRRLVNAPIAKEFRVLSSDSVRHFWYIFVYIPIHRNRHIEKP